MTNRSPRYTVVLLCLLSGVASAADDSKPDDGTHKPRIINTTDLGADPDDEQSMVRQLVCANEFDIEGLIVSTGCWKKTQSDTKMLDKLVDAYAECYDNLKVHADGFPTPGYLRSISVMGQKGYGMSDVGDGKDSPGSNLIIASVDKDDPRPVWIGAWGGANNIAQAIWKVRATRSKAELNKFLSKLRVFDILGQDDAGAWIAKNFPEVLYIRAVKVYGWQPPKNGDYQRKDIQSHGPLGAVYPDTKWATEGDTPAFMHVYPNGLNDPDRIDQGGWGGRFSWEKQVSIKSMRAVKQEERQYDPYEMYGNTPDGTAAIKRWSKGYNNDFAARMDWSITSKFEDANHHPIAVVNGDWSRRVLEVSAEPGAKVILSAEGSNDPDKDALTCAWSFYDEPSSFAGSVEIANKNGTTATVSVPSSAAGKNLHIILELHDDGAPSLYAYRRVIVNVEGTVATSAEEGTAESAATANESRSKKPTGKRLRVVMTTDFPPIGVVKGGNFPNDQKSDPDDMQSIVRFLLYANEFDVEGLVVSSGTFANKVTKQNMLDVIDRYAMVYDNLKKHDPMYPTPDALRSITFGGRSGTWGKKGTVNIGEGKDSEASNALIAIVDKPDPRPVYVGIWGDCSVVAQAVWKVQNTRSEAELNKFLSKLRIHQIATQDGTIGWLRNNFPKLFIIHSAKTYQGMFGGRDSNSDLAWINKNIRKDHGPLCEIYPHEGMGCTGVCEGDSPAFLWLVSANRGLNDPDDPTQESWGGQFKKDGNKNHYIDGPGRGTISKWRKVFQKEFAQRADWCVK